MRSFWISGEGVAVGAGDGTTEGRGAETLADGALGPGMRIAGPGGIAMGADAGGAGAKKFVSTRAAGGWA